MYNHVLNNMLPNFTYFTKFYIILFEIKLLLQNTYEYTLHKIDHIVMTLLSSKAATSMCSWMFIVICLSLHFVFSTNNKPDSRPEWQCFPGQLTGILNFAVFASESCRRIVDSGNALGLVMMC